MVTAEIVTVGNEVLLGDVLDTNTNWLCRLITRLGGQVERAVTVRDDVAAIRREVEAVLTRRSALLITSGGLGPTPDDVTLAAIAAATGRGLALDEAARALVAERYAELARQGQVADAALTPAREKMATVPAGATPLANPVGAAPGVLLRAGVTAIVALPGVPREQQAIVDGALQPLLRELFGERVYVEKVVRVTPNDESRLAPVLRQVGARHPAVYLKSRPERFGTDLSLRVVCALAGPTWDEAEQGVDAALADLGAALAPAGLALVAGEA